MNIIIKAILSIAVLLMISTVTSASLHNVTGHIYEGGVGLTGVTVTDNESIDTTVTNATGYYILDGYTNQTSYILTASKTGYTSNTLTIDFLDANLTGKDITIVKTSLTAFITSLTSIVTGLTTMFTAIMLVFMEPPLVLFIAVVLFVFIIGVIRIYIW